LAVHFYGLGHKGAKGGGGVGLRGVCWGQGEKRETIINLQPPDTKGLGNNTRQGGEKPKQKEVGWGRSQT